MQLIKICRYSYISARASMSTCPPGPLKSGVRSQHTHTRPLFILLPREIWHDGSDGFPGRLKNAMWAIAEGRAGELPYPCVALCASRGRLRVAGWGRSASFRKAEGDSSGEDHGRIHGHSTRQGPVARSHALWAVAVATS